MSDSDAWKNTMRSLIRDVKDPHLRAIFILLSSNLDFEEILNNRSLSLLDRLGIALRYLDDAQVCRFLLMLITDCVVADIRTRVDRDGDQGRRFGRNRLDGSDIKGSRLVSNVYRQDGGYPDGGTHAQFRLAEVTRSSCE